MRKKVFYNISNNKVVLAFFINVIFLLMAVLFCDMKYEVSDDFIMDSVLSGAYGDSYNEYMIFSSIFLGKLLKSFYAVFPIISWYFVFQILLCFCSLWTLVFIILKQNNTYVGVFFSILFVSFFSDDLYILIQFTKTAIISITSGGCLILCGIWKNKVCKTNLFFGFVLVFFGTLLRFDGIFVALPFLIVIFIKKLIVGRNHLSIKFISSRFGTCVLFVVGIFIIHFIGTCMALENEDYRDYKLYNDLRVSVTDIKSYPYEDVAQIYKKKFGFSRTDYYMIESWNFMDKKVFDEELIRNLAELKKEFVCEDNKSVLTILKELFEREYYKYMIVIGNFLLIVSCIILEEKNKWLVIFDIFIMQLLLVYLCLIGRIVYRVEYGIFVCMAISILSTMSIKEVRAKKYKKLIIGASILFLICKTPLYIHNTNWNNLSEDQYREYIDNILGKSHIYNIRKYRCDTKIMKPYDELISYMKKNEDKFYLLDFVSTIQLLYFNYEPWERLPIGYYDDSNYCYLTGVLSGHYEVNELWKKRGIDSCNPYLSLLNEGIYLIDNYYYEIKLLYLQERYNENIQMKLIDTIDGFKIWKYYIT